MAIIHTKRRTHHYPWPVLLALVLGVVVPTACVIWFMTEAMQNERLAVHQKLVELYRNQLLIVQKQFQLHLQAKINDLNGIDNRQTGAENFAYIVNNNIASSAILYDSNGKLLYPDEAVPAAQEVISPQWSEAQRLEYQLGDVSTAAGYYAEIANQALDATLAGRALQARARCLFKSGEFSRASDILSIDLADNRYRHITDFQGRLIQPNAQLWALQMMDDTTGNHKQTIITELMQRLMDYKDTTLAANQRLFLMQQLHKLDPNQSSFPSLAAESLAITYLESNHLPQIKVTNRLYNAQFNNVWHMASTDRTVLTLFTLQDINSEVFSLTQELLTPSDVVIKPLPPFSNDSRMHRLLSVPLGDAMPGWKLGLYLKDTALLNTAAEQQIAAYLWTGILIVITIILLAAIIAHYVGEQIKLNRLKNDLIATVSHELKTPLSSMRVLVDTLLDGGEQNPQKTHEYLQLIAKENIRLSRLIDNFLTFSRMERNRQSFAFKRIDANHIAADAMHTTREKFTAARFQFDVQLTNDPLLLFGDADFLITVLINLLDNAFKYSANHKHIILRTYLKEQCICISVQDHGIGLSQRHTRKIFDRFYRVDQKLTQEADGCGLGLNIVKYIVKSHQGFITVKSQLGQGSTFTVSLPQIDSKTSKKLQRNHD